LSQQPTIKTTLISRHETNLIPVKLLEMMFELAISRRGSVYNTTMTHTILKYTELTSTCINGLHSSSTIPVSLVMRGGRIHNWE